MPTPDIDQIEVIGHVALDGTGVTGLTNGAHWRRSYLYLSSAEKITIVNVSSGSKPKIEADYHYAVPGSQARAVVGSAALLAEGQPPIANLPRSISIVSFADPAKPEVLRKFTNITGFLADRARGLIYIVNNEGLWILSERPGRDLELEKQYEHDVLYNR